MIPEVNDFLELLTKEDIAVLLYYLTAEKAKLNAIAEKKGLTLDDDDAYREVMTEYHRQKLLDAGRLRVEHDT